MMNHNELISHKQSSETFVTDILMEVNKNTFTDTSGSARFDQKNFTLLSSLFAYPTSPWLDFDQLRRMVSEPQYSLIRKQVQGFLDTVQEQTLEQVAQQYVMTFDFSENSNLDLTSLLCLDDRKRGLLLANLKSIYHQAGLEVESGELPDYLPMILEFLSVAGPEDSKVVLDIVRPGMEKLGEQLKKNNSLYAGVVEACLAVTVDMVDAARATKGGIS